MLTRKQLDLLNYINKHLNKDGIPPSFDEMKEALDLRSSLELQTYNRSRGTGLHSKACS